MIACMSLCILFCVGDYVSFVSLLLCCYFPPSISLFLGIRYGGGESEEGNDMKMAFLF